MKKHCTVLLTNDAYFNKMLHTLQGILNFEYNTDIVVVIGDDLKDSDKLNHPTIIQNNVIIKYFSDIKFSEEFDSKFHTLKRTSNWVQRKFQYHKFNIFNTFFKQWKFIFYIDSGATVLNSIDIMFNAKRSGKFCAHSDAYPNNPWFLKRQFDDSVSFFSEMYDLYNLEIDYPQTTVMLFDTELINEHTFNELYSLAERWPISLTNDQGIIALYFASIKNTWEQIQLGDEKYWYYDFSIRDNKLDKPHIVVKYI